MYILPEKYGTNDILSMESTAEVTDKIRRDPLSRFLAYVGPMGLIMDHACDPTKAQKDISRAEWLLENPLEQGTVRNYLERLPESDLDNIAQRIKSSKGKRGGFLEDWAALDTEHKNAIVLELYTRLENTKADYENREKDNFLGTLDAGGLVRAMGGNEQDDALLCLRTNAGPILEKMHLIEQKYHRYNADILALTNNTLMDAGAVNKGARATTIKAMRAYAGVVEKAEKVSVLAEFLEENGLSPKEFCYEKLYAISETIDGAKNAALSSLMDAGISVDESSREPKTEDINGINYAVLPSDDFYRLLLELTTEKPVVDKNVSNIFGVLNSNHGIVLTGIPEAPNICSSDEIIGRELEANKYIIPVVALNYIYDSLPGDMAVKARNIVRRWDISAIYWELKEASEAITGLPKTVAKVQEEPPDILVPFIDAWAG